MTDDRAQIEYLKDKLQQAQGQRDALEYEVIPEPPRGAPSSEIDEYYAEVKEQRAEKARLTRLASFLTRRIKVLEGEQR